MTDIVFDANQLSYIISLVLFMYFFWIGYMGEKRSSGAFMIVAGLLMIGMAVTGYGILPALLWLLLIPVGIFITLLGINKFFITPNMPNNPGES